MNFLTVTKAGDRVGFGDGQEAPAIGSLAGLVECRLQTGRTHQIRVHMAHIGYPLVGDPVYGKSSPTRFLRQHKVADDLSQMMLNFPRQALHAAQLEFIHPISENRISLRADLPEDMQGLIAALRAGTKV